MKSEASLARTVGPNVASQRLGSPWGVFVKAVVTALPGLIFPLAYITADEVYVCGYGGPLQKLSTSGMPSLVTSNLSGLDGPVGLVCDNVGNVYAGEPSTSRIWRFSPDGSSSVVGFPDDEVSGLAFDTTGILYLTSPNWTEVAVPDYLSGKYYLWGGSAHSGTGGYAITLTLDSSNNVYVANNADACPQFCPGGEYNNTIQKFAGFATFTNRSTFASGLNCPWGMAFDDNGSLYVANSGTNGDLSNTILKFSTNGTSSVFATATNGLSGPRGLAFDSAGNLYVANSLTGTILKFTPDGTASVFASGLTSPTSIAIYPGLKVWSATPIRLGKPTVLSNGALQFSFVENLGLSFTVLASTNASSSIADWSVAGVATEAVSTQYQFTDTQATNYPQRFYRVRSP
jgi:sugar lactone lactonase YvrE